MSYDLGVWVGARPADDDAAGAEYEKWCELDEEQSAPASPAIAAFVAELLTHYPDLGEPGDDSSPWASGPLLSAACGDFLPINLTWSGAEQGRALVAEVARRHGLVDYDPQGETLV